MIHNQTECIICGKVCSEKDWVVYDNISGFCKCRQCMLPRNAGSEPWAVPFPRMALSKMIGPNEVHVSSSVHLNIHSRLIRTQEGEVYEYIRK